jgi:hypothetical protein
MIKSLMVFLGFSFALYAVTPVTPPRPTEEEVAKLRSTKDPSLKEKTETESENKKKNEKKKTEQGQ